MTDENARLTDFGNATDAGREAATGGAAAGSGDDGAADATEEGGQDVDPAAATASWDPGGAACADCGAVVERRWRDGDVLVCPECKAW